MFFLYFEIGRGRGEIMNRLRYRSLLIYSVKKEMGEIGLLLTNDL